MKRIHFDRFEFFLLSGVAFLMCGMMFSFGVLVGFGMAEKGRLGEERLALTEGAQSVVGGARMPASQDHEQAEAGVGTRNAFLASKQQALNEIESVADSSLSEARSVADAKAYFSTQESGLVDPAASKRKPASEPQQKVMKRQPAAAAQKNVADLFERGPAAVSEFKPVSGDYSVRLFSYSTLDEAQAKVLDLRRAGYNEAFVRRLQDSGAQPWFRVSVGSYKDRQSAQRTAERLSRRGLASSTEIVKNP